jgi:hypothetical protein
MSSQRERCIIGVIGGDESTQADAARRVGAEIARAGQILLTGGKPIDTNEVKNAAMWGAKLAQNGSTAEVPVVARMIGILNSEAVEWNVPDSCSLFLKTGLSSYERDAINGLTPDVLVVFRGGRGTLCELAYAAAASKPLRFYDSADALRGKTRKHIADGVLRPVLEEALIKYRVVNGKELTSQYLMQQLLNAVDAAQNEPLNSKLTVRHAVEDAFKGRTQLGESGFPGLDRERSRFELLVQRIGHCSER